MSVDKLPSMWTVFSMKIRDTSACIELGHGARGGAIPRRRVHIFSVAFRSQSIYGAIILTEFMRAETPLMAHNVTRCNEMSVRALSPEWPRAWR